MTLARDFEDFVKLLNLHGVEYMVVGGYALAFHGKPRHTEKIFIEIKYQASSLCSAMLRYINDYFESVSFAILRNGDIQVKIILERNTDLESEYIYDIIAEFSAQQERDRVKKPIVEIGKNHLPLENIVYQKKKMGV